MGQRLTDRTAIVTGAAEGIGQTIARRLGEEGASVVVADVNEDAGTATVEALREVDVSATFVRCDVTSPDDADTLVEAALDRWGSVDILVNNAGITGGNSIQDTDVAEWSRMIEVNLTGAFVVTKSAAPAMIENGYGRIVNVSSVAGRVISYTGSPAYTASKWGLIGLTKHAAWDLGEHDITVNAVCPGPTLTDRVREGATEEAIENLKRKVPKGRWATPEDTANAIVYLVSEEGDYVNGSALDVDGGLLLGIRQEV